MVAVAEIVDLISHSSSNHQKCRRQNHRRFYFQNDFRRRNQDPRIFSSFSSNLEFWRETRLIVSIEFQLRVCFDLDQHVVAVVVVLLLPFLLVSFYLPPFVSPFPNELVLVRRTEASDFPVLVFVFQLPSTVVWFPSLLSRVSELFLSVPPLPEHQLLLLFALPFSFSSDAVRARARRA